MNSNLLLKLCAVSSSLLLVTAFVSYRAGALGWLMEANAAGSTGDVTGDEFSLTPAPEQMVYMSEDGPVFFDSPEEMAAHVAYLAEYEAYMEAEYEAYLEWERARLAGDEVGGEEMFAPTKAGVLFRGRMIRLRRNPGRPRVFPFTAPPAIDVVNSEFPEQQAESE